jgi:hypothetical protein
MDMKEHIYADDPEVGHPDVRTYLDGVDYFFSGNGLIQAAVQVCRSGEGTPLGLLIMHPDRFGPKRAALTCDESDGIEGTTVWVRLDGTDYAPEANQLIAAWDEIDGVPAVRVDWRAADIDVVEHFYCPGQSTPRIHRRVCLRTETAAEREVLLFTGSDDQDGQVLELSSTGRATAALVYEIVREDEKPDVVSRWKYEDHPSAYGTEYWDGLSSVETGDAALNHLFRTARYQLPTAVDANGRMDASIWQYNLEWVRDQVHVAEALTRLGDFERASTMLSRMLDEFVSDEGDVIDSGRHRDPENVELDQNGELLTALRTYVDWTGDLDLVRQRWTTVEKLASYPLRDMFRHEESGLLHNRREFWERHGGHGIQDGCELMHQFFVAMGLENAVYLSEVTGCETNREAWSTAAANLRNAFLENPKYRFIEDGHLIKRRGLAGEWQQAITRSDECVLPPEIPLMEVGPRGLDPDSSCVLPIVYEFLDPKSELATNTLAHMEQIWNQRWETGGYGRYNADSEADSPGAWPFASIFIARAFVETGDDVNVWRILRWLAEAPGRVAGSWFEFFGNRIAPPYAQNGIIPWSWAEMISLYVHHLLGIRPDLDGVTLQPYLLDGLDRMEATVPVHGHRLKLDIRRAASEDGRGATTGVESFEWHNNGVRLPLPRSDVEVTLLC